MVHGDIKPGNVLLSGDNPAKIRLSDFGLSQWRAEGLGQTLGQSYAAVGCGRLLTSVLAASCPHAAFALSPWPERRLLPSASNVWVNTWITCHLATGA